MSINEDLAQTLDSMASMLDLLGEDAFKVNAHRRAARLIRDLPSDAAELAKDRAALLALPGVGPKLADKVVEFAGTGRIAEHDELLARVPPGVLALLEVPGLGPKTVRAMWQQAGITDVAGLERAIADGSILSLPRMGDKAVAKIREALAFMKQSGQRLWLGRALEVAGWAIERLGTHPGVSRVCLAGSARRGRDTVADIDLVASLRPGHEGDGEEVGELLQGLPGVVQVLAAGGAKSSVRVGLGHDLGRWKPQGQGDGEGAGPSIQVDLRTCPEAAFGATLLDLTGSKDHNIRLRERAHARGLTLNEWGLFRDEPGKGPPHERGATPLAARTEEDVYAALGLPWIPPEVREDRGEFDHQGAWALLEVGQVRAELHAHTTASDGSLSIEELAREAKRRGFHTIAVTDHSQSSVQANGLKPDRLLRHIEAVRLANEAVGGITILAGAEVDIHADGSLDYDDALLDRLDVVVASPHTALSQEPAACTKRLLRALAHPLVNILGHPTGRLINRRAGLSPDMEQITSAAAEYGVALEINAHWMRLDLRDSHVRLAIDRGCLIAVDCDVHDTDDFDNLALGVATARRGWVTKERCVNTWPAPRLHAWLARGRGARARG
jgi:DNA polymerase (family X)